MVMLPEARAPKGVRLYAMGDVHGCIDDLRRMAALIEADLNARPPEDWRIIYLGDYVDRGPDSQGVIEFILGQMAARRVYALRGNHDQYLIDFMGNLSADGFINWMHLGGAETLMSYGLPPSAVYEAHDAAARQDLRARLIETMPKSHSKFLAGLPHMLRLGNYVFVHAGVRPGVDLAEQRPEDLIWIREPFLSSAENFGAVVVHGHTVVDRVTVRPNRIGIDTGVVFGGEFTCLVLEGNRRALLGPDGPEPLGMALIADHSG